MINKTAKLGAAILFVIVAAMPGRAAAADEGDRDLKIWMEGMNEMTSDSEKRLGLLERFSFGADLRHRYEFQSRDVRANNRERARLRFRFKPAFQISDELSLKAQLATGGTGGGSATSTNQTYNAFFDTKNFDLDRAYGEWNTSKIPMTETQVKFGKFGNPFWTAGGNQIVWDGDLAFEGQSAKFKFGLPMSVGLEVAGGYFWLNEVNNGVAAFVQSPGGKGQSLQSAQAVLKRKMNLLGLSLALTVGVDYHNWEMIQGVLAAAAGNTAGTGGTLLHDYELVATGAELAVGLPVKSKVTFYGQHVKNNGVRSGNVAKAFGTAAGNAFNPNDWNEGWMVGLNFASGSIFSYQKDFLKFGVGYREVEPDAVFNIMSDSDFNGGGHPGGSNIPTSPAALAPGRSAISAGPQADVAIKLMDGMSLKYTNLRAQSLNRRGIVIPSTSPAQYTGTAYTVQQIDLSVAFK